MKCEFPHCRRESDVTYVGREVCAEHWHQLCGATMGPELEFLAKIGLTRTAQGEVIETSGQRPRVKPATPPRDTAVTAGVACAPAIAGVSGV